MGGVQRCAGLDHDIGELSKYAWGAYDAVYAFAHAAQTLIEEGASSFDPGELVEKLKTVEFEGITGWVKFDANGDRETGVGYTIVNYGGGSGVGLGNWKAGGFQFYDGVTEVDIEWPTSNGVKPAMKEAVDEEGGGVPMAVVIAIVGGAVALFAVILGVICMKEQKSEKEKTLLKLLTRKGEEVVTVLTKENDKLKTDAAIMQEYNKEEIAMLEEQIEKFTQDMSATGVHKGMEKLLIKADELIGKVVIGAGAYGEVFKSDYRGTPVAVKTMKQVDEEGLERFQGEIMLMSGLRHQNIVTMVGCCWEKDLMALVMEFCEKGTSTDVLKSEGAQLTWDDPLLKWLLDVSRGMSYLHGMTYYDGDRKEQVKGIIHRDLKPDNCLVTETWGVKIADFGEARAALENATMTQVGTPIYIAPEVSEETLASSGPEVCGRAHLYLL